MRKCEEVYGFFDLVLMFSMLFCLTFTVSAAEAFAGEPYISVQSLAIDPKSPQTLFAGTSSGVFKSTDGGNSWKEVNNKILSNVFVSALAIDPSAPQTIYAATSGNGLFKTTDGGQTWTAINKIPPTMVIRSLVIAPSSPQTLYAGTSTITFKSTDGGSTWNMLSSTADIRSFAADPTSPQTVYAGGINARVYKSTDGGGKWTQVNTNMPIDLRGDFEAWLKSKSPLPTYSEEELEQHRETIRMAAVKDKETGSSRGLTGTDVCSLAIDPSSPQTLYAITSGYNSTNGIFKSTDSGKSWNAVMKGLPEVPGYTQVMIAPSSSNILYAISEPSTAKAGPGGGVFKSTDSGSTWTPADKGLPKGGVRSLAIDPSSPQTVYAGVPGVAGVYKSTDGGNTWTAAKLTASATSHKRISRAYCEASIKSSGMGYSQLNGIYLNPDGNLYSYAYQSGDKINPLGGLMGSAPPITDQQLEDFYSSRRKHIRQINPEEWQAKLKLLSEINQEPMPGNNASVDSPGDLVCRCYVYNNEGDKNWQEVKLRQYAGVMSADNKSPGAIELADWLSALRTEAFPSPKPGMSFPIRGRQ
jgi:photosystem II stability/assembly factor-like uncharacterized protein